MRVFADANILFSAAKTDGAVRRLLRELLAAGHTVVVDSYVVAEALRNLQRKGPDAVATLEAIVRQLQSDAPMVDAASVDARLLAWLPDKDRPVLAAAIRLRCDALVTGDRTHFGIGFGRSFGEVTIHSPASLAGHLLR